LFSCGLAAHAYAYIPTLYRSTLLQPRANWSYFGPLPGYHAIIQPVSVDRW